MLKSDISSSKKQPHKDMCHRTQLRGARIVLLLFFFNLVTLLFMLFSFVLYFSPICPFSVQQRSCEHADSAAQPYGADGDLGTTADGLHTTHHQLHGFLQLGETGCC